MVTQTCPCNNPNGESNSVAIQYKAAQRSWLQTELADQCHFKEDPKQPVDMETMKVEGGPFQGKLPEVMVPKHGIKLYKLTPASGESETAQKRSTVGDGLDKVTREWAEMKPSRIMGSHAFAV